MLGLVSEVPRQLPGHTCSCQQTARVMGFPILVCVRAQGLLPDGSYPPPDCPDSDPASHRAVPSSPSELTSGGDQPLARPPVAAPAQMASQRLPGWCQRGQHSTPTLAAAACASALSTVRSVSLTLGTPRQAAGAAELGCIRRGIEWHFGSSPASPETLAWAPCCPQASLQQGPWLLPLSGGLGVFEE